MELSTRDFFYISKYLGGFFYGVYSGVFALYLRHYAAKKGTTGNSPILFYALCVLYILSGVIMTLDILVAVFAIFAPNNDINLSIELVQPAIFGCCDFMAQSILIYRCWIVWRRNTRFVIIPIIMALAFLALWMAGIAGNFMSSDGVDSTVWCVEVTSAAIVMSMTLNALVTSLIVLRIFMVFREVKATTSTTLDEKPSSLGTGTTGGRKLRYIMFVVIESGMALFSIQLARVVSTTLRTNGSDSDLDAFNLFVSSHEMLNGIIPTIILVRISMGLSFHDETSLVEAAGSLRFAAYDPNTIPEMSSTNQENDTVCENHDDIQMPVLERRSALESIDKSIESKDDKQGDPVDSMSVMEMPFLQV